MAPVETFSGALGAPWTTIGTPVPTVVGGRLYNPVNTTYAGIHSGATTYSLAGTNHFVELVRRPNKGNDTTQAFFKLLSDTTGGSQDGVEIGVIANSLQAVKWVAGTATVLASTTYLRTAHRWLRFRESGGTVYWEAGPDGTTWPTVVHSATTASLSNVIFTALRFELGAGYFGTEPSPGVALWDNVNTVPVEAAGSVALGVNCEDSQRDAFETAAGKKPAIISTYWAWSQGGTFPSAQGDSIVARDATWALAWEPWNWNTGGTNQPTYTLASIIAGTHDSLITTFAAGAAAWGHPMIMRFAHEMNGSWYPWAESVNGNSAGQYATAWQHVRAIFVAQGATNVQWMWCPNVPFGGSTALSGLYPGDAHVDLIGLDGYNWGTSSPGFSWQTFDQVHGDGIAELLAIAPSKPIHICETASAEAGGDKAAWITDMWTQLLRRTEIRGLWWFHFLKETDWRINSSVAANAAFTSGVANDRYAITAAPPPPSAPPPSGLRRNLASNPACGVDATGWSSNPLGYARSTSVDAGLPRTTGFSGGGFADVNTPRAPVTAGQQYVWSVSVKASVTLSSNMLVNFYSSLTSGGFISNSGPTVPLNLAVGQVGRFIVGPYTVPAGAIAGLLKLNDLDGACEITGYRVAAYSGNLTTDGAYFDGASTGWSWDGTANLSSSTARVISETFTLTDSFSKLQTAAGPVGTDQIAFSESWSIAASGALSDSFLFRDGFLIGELAFDNTRGRVRVQAFTFGPTVTQVKVRRRTVVGGRYEDVRGGTVTVLGGYMARPVDDYEYPAGVDADYLLEGVNDVGVVVQSTTVRRDGEDDQPWLKFIANPVLNKPIALLTDFDGVEREARVGLFDVQGSAEPIAVTDVHSSQRMTVKVKTETPAETKALDQALRLGFPCFLQVPEGIPVPTMYASIGSYRRRPPTRKSHRSIFEIELTEIAAPAATIAGAFTTWQTVLDSYESWQQVYDEVPTWRELAA